MNDLTQARKLIKECQETQNSLLNLEDCLITDLRELPELFKCEHITFLNLGVNEISDISPLKEFPLLTYLYLSYNKKISDISPLAELPKIKYLDLKDNQISDISALENLTDLQILDLSNNQISNYSFLKDLKQLQSLNLSYNQISDYSFLKDLKQLQSLYLRNNQISDISFLENLSGLQTLDLRNNQISDISFLEKLTDLQSLDLRNNQISDISFLENLTDLQNLDLRNNQISDISFLEKLTNLNHLYLNDNQIKEIPESIFQLGMEIDMSKFGGNGLSLFGNPIESPPLDIIKQGKDAVLRHFERIEKEGGKDKLEYIYEAKLILIGKGNAGKTSLQKKLIDEKAQLPDSDKRTRGIEVVDFEFEKGKIAHIWDFGGQVIYYPVHRFFITKNAVFVLLASTREYDHNFEYWIPTIYQFGGQSPIIIGQTCHEGLTIPWNNFGVNLNNLDFNIIKTSPKPYIEIDLTGAGKNRGLKEIKQNIITQIEKLPHFGKGVPKSWATVRNALLEKSQSNSYISFEAFVNLCRQLEPVFLSKMEDITDCCQFFHDIGVLLWYSEIEELKNLVILKPEWAMNAVYKIIDNIDYGLIYKTDFDRLWDSDAYKDKHDILKKILERFKIAFPTRHSHNQTYIFPAKLTSMPLEKKWKLEELKENFLRLEYKFEFMPKGIVNQLSAELSEYIHDRDIWNDAVSIIHESSEAQIVEDSYNRKLSITSKGVDARGMNMLIMKAVKNIIGEYQGVEDKTEILVPCTCNICRKSERPTFFPYDKLLEWSLKRHDVTCNESGESFRIFELLYNAGFNLPKTTENTLSEDIKEIKHDTKRILGQQKEILAKLDVHYEYLITHLDNSITKDEIQKAIKEINKKQTKEIISEITTMFAVFDAEMDDTLDDKLKEIYNDLKKSDDVEAKLKLSIPFIKMLGVDFEVKFDVKNWVQKMYNKHKLKVFKLMGAV